MTRDLDVTPLWYSLLTINSRAFYNLSVANHSTVIFIVPQFYKTIVKYLVIIRLSIENIQFQILTIKYSWYRMIKKCEDNFSEMRFWKIMYFQTKHLLLIGRKLSHVKINYFQQHIHYF